MRLPNTPREVGVATERVATTARGVDGANAKVDDAKRQIAAMMAMMFFILAVFDAVSLYNNYYTRRMIIDTASDIIFGTIDDRDEE